MIDGTIFRGGVFIDEAEGGAADGFRDAKVPAQVLDQGGLPCAEVAAEEEDVVAVGYKGLQCRDDFSEIIYMVHLHFHAPK